MSDSYLQVAADGAGKQVDMTLLRTLAGDTIYRQRAELIGPPADALLELNAEAKIQTALLRAILFVLSNGDVTEDQFLT